MTRFGHIIVIGNEKGGSGKSTTAVHLVVGLQAMGFTVATVDLDARQATLTRYLENRRRWQQKTGRPIELPRHRVITAGALGDDDPTPADAAALLTDVVAEMTATRDFVVIDCPGMDCRLARLAHSFADTLITPLNDSFIDLDNLADIDPDSYEVRRPSRYAEAVWEQRKSRMMREDRAIDWIVMRNRLSTLDARNKRRIDDVLWRLSRRIGFRLAPGFSERVVYRELFLEGMTVLDLDDGAGAALSLSQVAARQEVRALIDSLRLPGVGSLAAAV